MMTDTNKKPKRPMGRPVDLMSVTQVAALKGVTRRAVLSAITAGTLPAQRVGRQWLLRPADLERWQPRRDWAPGRPRTKEEDGS